MLPWPRSKKKCVEPRVVAVLEHLDQREAEDAVVELHRALDVAADEGDVVHAACRAGRTSLTRQKVLLADQVARRAQRVAPSTPPASASAWFASPLMRWPRSTARSRRQWP